MKNYVHIDPPTFNEDQAFIDATCFTLSTNAHQNEEICFQLETYNTQTLCRMLIDKFQARWS